MATILGVSLLSLPVSAATLSGTPPLQSPIVLTANAATTLSPAAADQRALTAVGAGSILHTSRDTYRNQPVYDIHVLDGSQVWDVKVGMNGQILVDRLATEQGTSSTPKDSQSSAADSPSHAAESSDAAAPSGSDAKTPPTTLQGIPFNQKLTVAPAQFSPDISQAMSAVNGVSLKWVKFQAKSHGDFQMNIKIRLAQGTTKVKDVFNASGQLISQKLPTDSSGSTNSADSSGTSGS